jgi:geranylgeranyl diphosphate synthase type II
MDLKPYLLARQKMVDAALDRFLPRASAKPATIHKAMRHSLFAGGKRLRPILCIAAAEACGGTAKKALPAACAVECLHTYSLVHDDLPCMDDDALRRGKPTCHVVHGEAMALLAGDALQSLGFEVLASRPRGEAFAARRADAVLLLARAIGASGMAGGQALDLAAAGHGRADLRTAGRLEEIHEKKTGRLLSAACELGAVLAGADPGRREAAARYGASLGVLFQIADDLLDVTATAAVLGKSTGKDQAQEKLTYVSVYGVSGAVAEREKALAATLSRAGELEGAPGLLAALAEYAGHRDR